METVTRRGDPGVGNRFVDAVARGDFDAVEACFAPDVRFRAMTPRRIREAASAGEARAIVAGWFDESDEIGVVTSGVETVVDRLHVSYRLRLREAGTWKLVEQQVFAVVEGDRLTDVSLVCSGFRPIQGVDAQEADPLRADAHLDAIGEDCATLTPRIRAALRELRPGDVLEVAADDPAAEDGLLAWSRLTGNALVGATDAPTGRHFYLRRG